MKNLKFLLLAMALCVALVFALSACGPTTPEETSSSESTSESQSEKETVEYKVTFYYADLTGKTTADLAAMLASDGTLSDKTLYTKSIVKTSDDGDGVSGPTNSQMKSAEVRGYKRGWSTNDWKEDGINSDLSIYATYTKLKDVKVTFVNSNGALINVLDTYATYNIDKTEYPNTYDLVYYYSATYLATLEEVNMADYVVYVPKDVNGNDILMDKNSKVTTDAEAAETQYVLAADEAKLATNIALPFGWYFESWNGKTANLSVNGTVKADIKAADGVVKKSRITVDGTKDDGYVKIGGLYPNIISNKRENGKIEDYPLYAEYKTEAEIDAAVLAGSATATDKQTWLAQKAEWEAQTKPLCDCGIAHEPIDATLYLAWDGNFVYVYAEVKDPHVVSHGKNYCQGRANPYENDGVEIWYGIAGDFNKVCLDAFGYQLYGAGKGQPTTSAYINECASASKLMTASGYLSNDIFDAWNGAIVTQDMSSAAGVVGYAVEFSFAAYEEPILADGEELADDKSNWGNKLLTGHIFSLSIQLDDITEAASQDVVDRAVASESTGAQSIDALYKADGVHNPNERINIGVQATNADQDGVFTLVLG